MNQKEKNRLRSLKGQNTRLKNELKGYKKREKFIEAIDITKLEDLSPLTVCVNRSKKEEVIPISTLSDAHVEEEVVRTVVNGLNEYNLKVAEQRVLNYFKRLIYMLKQVKKAGYKYNTIVIGLLGDFITGFIHEELEETNLLTPPQAAIFAQELLAKGIKLVVNSDPTITSIKIPCIPGNHGRTTRRKRYNTGFKNSYEYMMYHNLQQIFKNSPGYEHVEFFIAESEFLYMDLFGYINMFSHGDHFRYQGGIGGIEVPLKKFILRENNVIESGIDMAWMGHWHQYIVLNKVRINGSVIGYNAYARSFGFEPELPKMQFQLLDKKRGYTLNNPIYLNDF
jgi:hypothetical protein